MTRNQGRAWQAWAGAALIGASGCAGTWEEITSREFEMRHVRRQPDPLVVLRDSTDEARKAQALSRLQEPIRHGGTREDQELCLQILTRAAINESPGQYEPLCRNPLCRLSAIRMLGEYQDPRTVGILEKAYLDAHPFTPEMNAMIRQQTLTALEKTGNAEARHILIRAARRPSASAVSSQTERQYILDEKLAAVRTLGKFATYDAVDTLVYLLENDKDVAVRHCAHSSLKTATKRDLPADPRAWRELQARGPEAVPAAQPSMIERAAGVFSRDEVSKK